MLKKYHNTQTSNLLHTENIELTIAKAIKTIRIFIKTRQNLIEGLSDPTKLWNQNPSEITKEFTDTMTELFTNEIDTLEKILNELIPKPKKTKT